MKGYVVRKGNQHYAVIYEGRDPVTGRERRRWHPAGPNRDEADALAAQLASERMRDPAMRRSSSGTASHAGSEPRRPVSRTRIFDNGSQRPPSNNGVTDSLLLRMNHDVDTGRSDTGGPNRVRWTNTQQSARG